MSADSVLEEILTNDKLPSPSAVALEVLKLTRSPDAGIADIGRLTKPQSEQIGEWITRGGIALRFAGPKMAKSADSLTPVRLRGGGRALGGAMSWSQPAKLRPFDPGGLVAAGFRTESVMPGAG